MHRSFFAVVILLASLSGCGQVPQPTAASRQVDVGNTTQPAMTPIQTSAQPIPAIHHVLIISIDGLRPDVALRADMPNLRRLLHSGSYSFWARTTAMAVTLPSHTSMLTGVTPSRHEIWWNKEEPFSTPIYPSVPTLFELAHRAGYTTAMVAGKSKFQTLNKPGTIDSAFIPVTTKTEDADVVDQAVHIIRSHKPQVMFVHFPSVDNAGHKSGWGTPAQIKAAEGADAAVGKVLAALSDTGLLDSTFILLTADHGGAGRTHGPDDPRSRHIPWIACGPGINKDLDLTTYPKLEINTEDTFATACWLLGIPIDVKVVEGKPIVEIMQRTELLQTTR